MAYSDEELERIYDRTNGRCHLCHKKLAFRNYGAFGARGAWDVEHSVARATGGLEHANNRYAACVSCNRSKGTRSSRSVRMQNGVRRSPMGLREQKRVRVRNATRAAILAPLAARVFLDVKDPKQLAQVAALGALVGHEWDPE
jgi:hypothetical protein